MTETIKYLLTFLLYGNEQALPLIGYTSNPEEAKNYKLVIRPSENSPLVHPEKTWEAFYQEVRQVLHQRAITQDTDIVSVAGFLLSRAEETVITARDSHGRFLAAHSLLSEGNLLSIPLIDEYSRWLLKRLELPLPEQRITAVNLTHDVDTIEFYRHLRGAIGGIMRGKIHDVIAAWKDIEDDPAFTFPWMCNIDSKCKKYNSNTNIIYFLKASDGKKLDYPQYPLHGKDFEHLIHYIKKSNAVIGLHTSYAAGAEGNRIRPEFETLNNALTSINCRLSTSNRHHWLRSVSIDNMQQLAAAGITDDYTIGFADKAGFRLCTSRPVRWINPKTLKLTNLTLHPLTIMDCTLSNTNYMNLNEEEAFYLCQQLIDKTRQNSGELTLLWHNSVFSQDSYHKSLYPALLDYINS
ncbi:MAG: polysaccharide deacetylase family protein [Paludibacteraceae bacterium]|nr:polysaccharide deacetylase family protein [Paludibacteraceae bacterium]